MEPFLGLYKEGWGCLFQHNIEFLSLSLSLFLRPRAHSPGLEFALGWGFHHHPDAVALPESGSGSIFFPLLFYSEPGGTSVAPYVCNPARHYTCGATSSSEVLKHDREVVGSESTPTTFDECFPKNLPVRTASQHNSSRDNGILDVFYPYNTSTHSLAHDTTIGDRRRKQKISYLRVPNPRSMLCRCM